MGKRRGKTVSFLEIRLLEASSGLTTRRVSVAYYDGDTVRLDPCEPRDVAMLAFPDHWRPKRYTFQHPQFTDAEISDTDAKEAFDRLSCLARERQQDEAAGTWGQRSGARGQGAGDAASPNS